MMKKKERRRRKARRRQGVLRAARVPTTLEQEGGRLLTVCPPVGIL